MGNTTSKVAVVSLVVTAVTVAVFFLYNRQSGPEKVSRFGQYQGYSEAIYDGYVRRSDYLTLSDGTKLAYDVLLPAKEGVPADEPLPVLFKLTPYLRTWTMVDDGKILIAELVELKWYEKALLRIWAKLKKDGHLRDPVGSTPWLDDMIKHGYVVVVVERAGTGASFGVISPSFEVATASEILDWIAAQPWSDGNIGMFGDSWQAQMQFAAASAGNPHLKAIFPCSGSFDNYDAVIYPGGVYNKGFGSLFSWSTTALETLVTPVDSDEDGTLLAQALEERGNQTVGEKSEEVLKKFPFRDSTRAEGPKIWEEDMGLYTLLDRINQSGVPVYGSNGWYDLFTRDMFLWHANLTAPRRLHIRPLSHSDMDDSQSDLDYGAEAHRWFDYWLRGIDNGIMDEPPIYYYVMGASEKDAWRTSDQWPLANQQLTRFYFAEGKTDSVNSVNDGFLRTEPPGIPNAYDAYTVNYSTTSGVHSRWTAVVLEAADYPDMRANDEKALTYTTPPLKEDVEITGHPVVHLWIATDAPDLDFFVYLEEVNSRGKSTYVTEGNLRASHRALSEAPFNNLGLPYQRSYESDLAPIPAGEPIELVFDLLPTSKLFHKGNRIRVTITGADADNFETPILDPAPEIRLLRNTTYVSFVELPIIAGR